MSLSLQSDQFILLESAMWCHIIHTQSIMVVGFVRTWCVVGIMKVKFVEIHVPINAHVLTKFTSSVEIGSSQLYQLWSIFDLRAQGVSCLR